MFVNRYPGVAGHPSNHYGLKGWMPVKITGRFVSGRMLAPQKQKKSRQGFARFIP